MNSIGLTAGWFGPFILGITRDKTQSYVLGLLLLLISGKIIVCVSNLVALCSCVTAWIINKYQPPRKTQEVEIALMDTTE